jgi:hypothetical protein
LRRKFVLLTRTDEESVFSKKPTVRYRTPETGEIFMSLREVLTEIKRHESGAPEWSEQRRVLQDKMQRQFDRGNSAAGERARTELLAFDVLTSHHVSSVEVSFVEERDSVRIYEAVTHDECVPHRYRVAVASHEKYGRVIQCQCLAAQKETATEYPEVIVYEPVLCRHVIATAAVDSRLHCGAAAAPLNLDVIARYKGHLRREKQEMKEAA